MVRVTTHISDSEKAFLDKAVEKGDYLNVSGAVRDAIRLLMREKGEHSEAQ